MEIKFQTPHAIDAMLSKLANWLISTQGLALMLVHKAIKRAEVQSRVISPLQDELHISGDLVLLCARFEGAPDPLYCPI